MLKNKFKNNGGITLIALVITIVVMLILAGVTINLTLGENGIFTTAQKAAQNYTEAQEQELSQLSDFTDGLTVGKVARIKDGVQYIGDGAGNLIPVPVGFSYLEGTKNTGFVIKNDKDENEFVWIPVGNIANYQRVAWVRDGWKYTQGTNGIDEKTGSTKITRADLTDVDTYYWTEKMPEDERNSVTAYGGYYIGRYEAGVINATENREGWNSSTGKAPNENWTSWTVGDNIKLVIQGDQQVWNYITRDKAKEVAEDLYDKTTNNVKSKLCSSFAWDSALKFIEKNNKTYPNNSVGGNYGTGTRQPTGYHKVNNIYDMGGNVWEWTTESYSDTSGQCVGRGGSCYYSASDAPATIRGRNSTTGAGRDDSFRVVLFM